MSELNEQLHECENNCFGFYYAKDVEDKIKELRKELGGEFGESSNIFFRIKMVLRKTDLFELSSEKVKSTNEVKDGLD